MPDYSLSDIVKTRLEVISFFLLVALLLAFVFQRCWNSIARDFTHIPPLNFRKSLAVIFVASLFAGLILTMISGARELMTPGAWERTGSTYKLREPQREPIVWLDAARRRAMEQLRDALWAYASTHDGKLPDDLFVPELPPSLWRSPDPSGTPYGYLPRGDRKAGAAGPSAAKGSAGYVLVHEPMAFGPERFVLLSTGEVFKLKASELMERVKSEISTRNTTSSQQASRP
jgi:hypothetical protein